ncbi:Uncharacterized protein EJ110_NYTH05305 [Nymphaea thermarum]|nr:Uncharacterized protein EJ110_NYTH05305 [Nymphaea thermarum]
MPAESLQSFKPYLVSTGSFFHEKTTTLGTLMGVRPRLLSPSASSTSASRSNGNAHHNRQQHANTKSGRGASPRGGAHTNHHSRRRKGHTWWWRLCRDTTHHPHTGSPSRVAAGHSSRSLGDFLQVERRSIVDEYLGGGRVGGGLLFVDGRVVPPSQPSISAAPPPSVSLSSSSSSSSRMPVFGICSSSGRGG